MNERHALLDGQPRASQEFSLTRRGSTNSPLSVATDSTNPAFSERLDNGHSDDASDPHVPTTAEEEEEEDRRRLIWGIPVTIILCVSVATLSALVLGYDIGVMSGAKIFMRDDLHLGDIEVQAVVAVLNLVAALGGLVSGKLSDRFGRKATLAAAGIFEIAGSILMAVGPNFGVVLVGRILDGIGVGAALMVRLSRGWEYLVFIPWFL